MNPKIWHLADSVHTLILIDGGESHDLLLSSLQVFDKWIKKLTAGPEHAENDLEYKGFLYKVSL